MVRFAADGLPTSILRCEGGGGGKECFVIPNAKRQQTLQFMMQHPQHIVKRRKAAWEVIGIPPKSVKPQKRQQRGGRRGNSYGLFLAEVKKALMLIPEHDLNRLSPTELEKHPKIRELYERHFQAHPELINYSSILNTIASGLLNYDSTTGAVRESIADVRQRRQLPASTLSDLELTKENEFHRLLVLALDSFLSAKNIPALFLKSNYFTLRPQLQQVYQEDPGRFRGQLERLAAQLEVQVWADYSTFVNDTNRVYLSKYPFEDVALGAVGLTSIRSGFARFRAKLQTITRWSRTTPQSSIKFGGGLDEMTRMFASSPESKLMSLDHFMYGLQNIMNDDRYFVGSVLKDGSRYHNKVVAILKGNSL